MTFKVTILYENPNKREHFTLFDEATIQYLVTKYPNSGINGIITGRVIGPSTVEFTFTDKSVYDSIMSDPLIIERKSLFDSWNSSNGINVTITTESGL